MSGRRARVLLIGNSRWHWAETAASRCIVPSVADPDGDLGAAWSSGDGPPPPPGAWAAEEILAWAAVGSVPERYGELLPASRRLQTFQVPLMDAPSWLGVDRALVAWRAWRRQQALEPAPVLVADAGTVLSLTLVGRQGHFLGGRLLAGVALQWRAMAAGTAQLPVLEAGDAIGERLGSGLSDLWPQATTNAMQIGVIQGLAAAVAGAYGQLHQGGEPRAGDAAAAWQGMGDLRLWLCGGDGPRLAPLLRVAGVPVIEAPHLAMEALISLALNQLAGIS